MANEFKIIYALGANDEMEDYFKQKGFRNDVSVEIGSRRYEVYFFMASTLEYEMTSQGFCSFPGLIILENITTPLIEIAIEQLFLNGYFNFFVSLKLGNTKYWDKIHINPKSF